MNSLMTETMSFSFSRFSSIRTRPNVIYGARMAHSPTPARQRERECVGVFAYISLSLSGCVPEPLPHNSGADEAC
jgi:hypothetical protein